MIDRVKISKAPEAVPKSRSDKVEHPGGVEHFYYDDELSRHIRPKMLPASRR